MRRTSHRVFVYACGRRKEAGDEITITFYRSKVPEVHAGVIAKAVLADGKEILRFQRDTPTTGDGVR